MYILSFVSVLVSIVSILTCTFFFGVDEALGFTADLNGLGCTNNWCIFNSHFVANCTLHTSHVTELVLDVDGVCNWVGHWGALLGTGALWTKVLCALSSRFDATGQLYKSQTMGFGLSACCCLSGTTPPVAKGAKCLLCTTVWLDNSSSVLKEKKHTSHVLGNRTPIPKDTSDSPCCFPSEITTHWYPNYIVHLTCIFFACLFCTGNLFNQLFNYTWYSITSPIKNLHLLVTV